MDFDQFDALAQQIKSRNPVWFESPHDHLASDEDIKRAEEQLTAKFPPEYARFLKAYGGGYFAFVNIFSVDPTSDWYVVSRNATTGAKDFLAVSDDESGGYYGFTVVNGICSSKIRYFDFETMEILHKPVFDSLLEYLLKVGLKQEAFGDGNTVFPQSDSLG